MQEIDVSKRKFLQKVAYTAPLVVTLSVMPSIASAGSPLRTPSPQRLVDNGPENGAPLGNFKNNGQVWLNDQYSFFKQRRPRDSRGPR